MDQRMRRSVRARRRRKKALRVKIALFVFIIIGVVGSAFLLKKYGPSKERADLNEYYGILENNQLAVIIDNEVIGGSGKIWEGEPYVEYSVVRDYLNSRVYVDLNENLLLYTFPTGSLQANVGSKEYSLQKENKTAEHALLKMEGKVAYVSLSFVKEYSDIEYTVYEEPNRVMIESDWSEKTVATIRKDTQVRYRGGVKSPILTDVSKNDKVTVVESEENWKKIRTEDGFVGYVKKSHLKGEEQEVVSRSFEEVEYKNISKDYTINMAWHVVTNRVANDSVLRMIANTKGLTTISPTWFTVADTQGNVNSLASSQYVNYAHQSGIEVWALVRDFDGGIDSTKESYELLSRTSSRENLINQLMAEALKTGIDGINVDFENISVECGEHFIQFIRELSVKCRQNEIILSVDNYVPKGYNDHYDLEEQGKVADYVIIMGYDEHYSGSYESGPVASLGFVKDGIEETLEVVPKEKTINAVPFFTRLWKEVPKTEEQLEKEQGTEAAEYAVNVTSVAYGMNEAQMVVKAAGAKIKKDKETGQNYAQWKEKGATYKIWLEDISALESKLQLMKEYRLAGTSAWRLGFESSEAWEMIEKYVN